MDEEENQGLFDQIGQIVGETAEGLQSGDPNSPTNTVFREVGAVISFVGATVSESGNGLTAGDPNSPSNRVFLIAGNLATETTRFLGNPFGTAGEYEARVTRVAQASNPTAEAQNVSNEYVAYMTRQPTVDDGDGEEPPPPPPPPPVEPQSEQIVIQASLAQYPKAIDSILAKGVSGSFKESFALAGKASLELVRTFNAPLSYRPNVEEVLSGFGAAAALMGSELVAGVMPIVQVPVVTQNDGERSVQTALAYVELGQAPRPGSLVVTHSFEESADAIASTLAPGGQIRTDVDLVLIDSVDVALVQIGGAATVDSVAFYTLDASSQFIAEAFEGEGTTRGQAGEENDYFDDSAGLSDYQGALLGDSEPINLGPEEVFETIGLGSDPTDIGSLNTFYSNTFVTVQGITSGAISEANETLTPTGFQI